MIWLRFEQPLSGRFVLAVTEALRNATAKLYSEYVAPKPGNPAPDKADPGKVFQVLLGHGYSGSGYQHVHWLALPDVGRRYATGRIHGAAVWFPPDTPANIIADIREALRRLTTLAIKGGKVTSVRFYDGSKWPLAATPKRWVTRSSIWATVFPVVHERWGKIDLGQVANWCKHAGLPEPIRFVASKMPYVEGAVLLRPDEVYRVGKERRPYSHLVIEFAEPVDGPVVLGRERQFGLGLAVPLLREDKHLFGGSNG
jgi:CRISPR-associated protein Csb2